MKPSHFGEAGPNRFTKGIGVSGQWIAEGEKKRREIGACGESKWYITGCYPQVVYWDIKCQK